MCHLTIKVQLHLHEALLHLVPSYAVLLVGHFCYTVLGRKMKFALRLVMPIHFPIPIPQDLKHRTEKAGEHCESL